MADDNPFRTKPVRLSDMAADAEDASEKGGITFPTSDNGGNDNASPSLEEGVRVLEEHVVEHKPGLLERMLMKNKRTEELQPGGTPTAPPRESVKPGDGLAVMNVRETPAPTPPDTAKSEPVAKQAPAPVPPSPWNTAPSTPAAAAPTLQNAQTERSAAPVPTIPSVTDAAPVAHTEPAAATQSTPPVSPIAAQAPASAPLPTNAGGMNLAALRERVLHESTNPAFHTAARTAQQDATVQGLAAQRKAKLAGMDVHALGEIHEAPSAAPTFADLAKIAEGAQSTQDRSAQTLPARDAASTLPAANTPPVSSPSTTNSAPQTSTAPTAQEAQHTPAQAALTADTVAAPSATPLAPAEAPFVPSTPHATGIAQVAENLRRIEAGEPLTGPMQTTSASPHLPRTPSSIPSLRTFRSDVEQTMMHDQTSVVQAIAAEEARRTRNTAPLVGGRPSAFTPAAYLLIGMSIVLVVLGGAGIGTYLFMHSRSAPVVAKESIPSFFTTEKQQELDITGLSRTDIMNKLMYIRDGVDVQVGAMTLVYLTRSSQLETREVKTLVTAPEVVEALNMTVPSSLTRTLAEPLMLGIHEYGKNAPYFVFKVGDYQAAFAGMLAWERTLNIDLAPLFGAILPSEAFLPAEPATVATSTHATTSTSSAANVAKGTSTAPATPAPTPGMRTFGFKDEVISNKEVRTLRNADGDIVLLWSFPDPSTLVITTNKNTYAEILVRMSSRRF